MVVCHQMMAYEEGPPGAEVAFPVAFLPLRVSACALSPTVPRLGPPQRACQVQQETLAPEVLPASLSIPLLSHVLFALDPLLASFPAFIFARHVRAAAFRAAFFSSSLRYAHLRPRFLLVSPLASLMLTHAPDFEPE